MEEIDSLTRKARKKLGNPYAFINGDGEIDTMSAPQVHGVHNARKKLQNQYAYLDGEGGYSHWQNMPPNFNKLITIQDVLGLKSKKSKYSKYEIEKIVTTLQRTMWKQKQKLGLEGKNIRPLDIINPSLALQSIGFKTELKDTLGQFSGNGELYEVAGIINNDDKSVEISRRFSPEIRNFTTAHELGHAILHDGNGLHRDRALDGSQANRTKDHREQEADTFSAYFLMPEKQVRKAFEEMFKTSCFILTDDTAFSLTSGTLESIQNECRSLRDLTRMIASTERYNGVAYKSLAKQFNVSIEAFAIRLEELKLVEL
jgi:Zn-dependent peptidase ImmA (M78 family)